jgi:hypothetical protein
MISSLLPHLATSKWCQFFGHSGSRDKAGRKILHLYRCYNCEVRDCPPYILVRIQRGKIVERIGLFANLQAAKEFVGINMPNHSVVQANDTLRINVEVF